MSNDDNSGMDNDDAPPVEYYQQPKDGQTDAEHSLPTLASIWWSFTWRFAALFLVSSLLVGMIFMTLVDHMGPAQQNTLSLISLALALPISFWSIGAALNKQHRGYKVLFVKPHA